MTAARYESLKARLRDLGSVLVAYSGGVDSTLLAYAARETLGDQMAAVLASSATYPAAECAAARELASRLDLPLLEIVTSELHDDTFASNPPDRCYHCKVELFGRLAEMASERRLSVVADGSNADDLADHRPGRRAAAQFGVVSPLADAGLAKADIRSIARELGLPNWDKPSMACLASRFPYGERISEEALRRVGDAEDAVRRILAVGQLRVRAHGDLARIEADSDSLKALWERREAVTAAVRAAGFAWVAFDADGYRTGSLNATLPQGEFEGTR